MKKGRSPRSWPIFSKMGAAQLASAAGAQSLGPFRPSREAAVSYTHLYARYPEQMQMLRKAVKEAPEELWSASLYAGWLYTLNPLLEEKGAAVSYTHLDVYKRQH